MDQSLDSLIKSLKRRAAVDFTKTKPKDILERLEKMLVASETARLKHNYDDAYIYLRRWIVCVEWLKKKNIDVSSQKIEQMKELLNDVLVQIQHDFEIKTKALNCNDTQSLNLNYEDVELRLPEAPTDEPRPKEKNEINSRPKREKITCTELLDLLNKYASSIITKIVIIDTRKSEEFDTSKISFTNNVISIPEDKFNFKQLTKFNLSLLSSDKKIMSQIHKKILKHTEFIVMLDTNSCLETINNISPIVLIKNYLEEIHPNSKFPKRVFLNGGFEEWNKKFPKYVIKTKVEDPSNFVRDVSNDSLDNIKKCISQNDYNLSQIPIIGRSMPGIDNKPAANSINLNTPETVSNNSSYFPSNENFRMSDESMIPQVTLTPLSLTESQIMKLNSRTSSLPLSEKMFSIPTVPNITMNGSYYTENEVGNKQQHLFNNKREPMLILEKVDSPSVVLKKPFVDRSNKPSQQRQSNLDVSGVLQELTSVKEKIETYKSNNNDPMFDEWNFEEYSCLIKRKQELMEKYEKLVKSQTTFAQNRGLYPSLPNIGKTVLATPKRTFDDDKENIQKPVDCVEKMSVEPQEPEDMEVDENETFNASFKRSYSSPNLVQEKDDRRIVPEVDRSSKPRLESTNSHKKYFVIASKDRSQNLNAVVSSSSHPGITGLKNLGNSCYMNSIVQCLSNTEYLAHYFNDNAYINDLNVEKNFTCVAEEVAHVIRALWRGTYKSISPLDLKVVVGHYKLQFKNHEQQDSHEFLTFILEWMHNDLKRKNKISYNRPLTTIETEWEKSMNGHSSIISKLFFGLLRSTVQCLYCKKNSTTYETFNSLTMSLPVSNKCTLDECVKKFVSGQKVSGWNCPNCKVPRDGEKKFDIAKLPHIIVIHLNRFGDTGGWLEKKNTAVDFPIAKFDLRPYLVSDDDTINTAQSSCYNLYAISNHYGTMDRGHYTAYCKSSVQSKWYKYDDHTVTEVPQNQVKSQSSSAYLLFYTSISSNIIKD